MMRSETLVALSLLVGGCGGLTSGAGSGDGSSSPGGAGGVGAGGTGASAGTAGATAGVGFGGGAGAGTAGGAGVGGTGGSGGNEVLCEGFRLQSARQIAGVPDHHETGPQLVRGGAQLATLGFRWDPYEGPITWSKVGHATFEAWGDWPADEPLAQAWVGNEVAGESFALAETQGGAFTFLTATQNAASPEPGLYLSQGTPESMGSSSLRLRGDIARTHFNNYLAASNAFFLGYESDFGGHTLLHVARYRGDLEAELALGCGTSPLSADAVRMNGFTLVALSTSRDFHSCLDDDGIDGPPTRLQLVRFDDDAPTDPKLILDFETSDVVRELALTPRSAPSDSIPGGAWLVWQTANNPIQGVRLNEDGDFYSLPNTLYGDGYWLEKHAVTDLGPYVAVSVLDAFDPSVPTISINIFDRETTDPVRSLSVFPSVDRWPTGPLALLGSPDERSLLIAWTAQSMTSGAPPTQNHVVRADCVFGADG